MDIRILHMIEGARMSAGLTVIIDVFRAFSTACYVAGNGAKNIIVTGSVDTAMKLKQYNPVCVLAGERHEKKIPGFDYGNSPAAIKNVDFTGKTVILTTSAGTQGIINASHARTIITGSFVNAGAIVRYIRKEKPVLLSLVCMGYAAQQPIEEDSYCADLIRNELVGESSDFEQMMKTIRATSGRRFFLPENQDHSPAEDFDLCLDLNRFDFVLQAEKTGEDQYELKKLVP
jgi:2-phosphosulfolactate phosphatase